MVGLRKDKIQHFKTFKEWDMTKGSNIENIKSLSLFIVLFCICNCLSLVSFGQNLSRGAQLFQRKSDHLLGHHERNISNHHDRNSRHNPDRNVHDSHDKTSHHQPDRNVHDKHDKTNHHNQSRSVHDAHDKASHDHHDKKTKCQCRHHQSKDVEQTKQNTAFLQAKRVFKVGKIPRLHKHRID